ncbi:hypothetical protein LENED_009036 [Lentinula edodes]|uniref:Uncharacterized protein n=1 Tax=Lentinula edodes TaxID=5353 RepID=A0A1Q3EIQ9_LENED|nr:hypothetical protein LENED_009036 [Lentinula edodes]
MLAAPPISLPDHIIRIYAQRNLEIAEPICPCLLQVLYMYQTWSPNKMLFEKLDVTIVSSRQTYAKHYLVDHLVIYSPRGLQPYFAIYHFLFATTYFCHYLTSRPSYFSWLWCEQSTKLFWLAIHGGSGHDVFTPSATPRIFKASSFRSEEMCPFIGR